MYNGEFVFFYLRRLKVVCRVKSLYGWNAFKMGDKPAPVRLKFENSKFLTREPTAKGASWTGLPHYSNFFYVFLYLDSSLSCHKDVLKTERLLIKDRLAPFGSRTGSANQKNSNRFADTWNPNCRLPHAVETVPQKISAQQIGVVREPPAGLAHDSNQNIDVLQGELQGRH
jgi:hypothetical protein